MPVECLEERGEIGLILPPDFDGIGIDGLAHLDEAGSANDPPVRVKLQTGRVPVELQEFDYPTRLTLEVGHQFFVVEVEPFDRPYASNANQALVVGEEARDVIPVAAPRGGRKARSPAGDRDVADPAGTG